MEFNDGSQYRVVTDPVRHRRERTMYEFRASSAKGGTAKYKDTAFDRHRRDFNGFPVLMYQFPYQNAGSPEAQAEYFLNIVGPPRDLDMYMLDTEDASVLRNPADFTRRWFDVVERRTGKLCWLYVPRSLSGPLNRGLTGPRIVKSPRYSGNASRGAAPNWQWDVHQYTDRGYFPGCAQSGDVNFTTWSTAQLLDRCNGGRAPSQTKKKTSIILLSES